VLAFSHADLRMGWAHRVMLDAAERHLMRSINGSCIRVDLTAPRRHSNVAKAPTVHRIILKARTSAGADLRRKEMCPGMFAASFCHDSLVSNLHGAKELRCSAH
jgi:hypothetical protein